MTLFIYSILAGAILSVLWLTFRLSGMGALTHFRLNRMILVAVLLLSLALPVIVFRHMEPVAAIVEPVELVNSDEEVLTRFDYDEVPLSEPPFDWSWLPQAYVAGACLCALWLLIGVVGVMFTIIFGEKRDGMIVHNRKMPPFTWGRYIVVSEKDADNTAVLLHERAHLYANHWLDLLLVRIADCLLWYWPSAWLLTRDLQTVHEYEADRAVLDAGIIPAQYQIMLVQAGSGRTYTNVVNPFNYYSLKKRIIMMKKKSSSARSRMRALVMLPVVAAIVLLLSIPAFASQVQSYLPKEEPVQQIVIVDDDIATAQNDYPLVTVDGEIAADVRIASSVFRSGNAVQEVCKVLDLKEDDIEAFQIIKDSSATARYGDLGKNGVINIVTKKNAAKQTPERYVDAAEGIEKTTRVQVDKDKVYFETEVAPQFPGGDTEMYKWLSRNIRYPENAAMKNVQGRVIVQFVVEKDGSIGEAKIIRGVDSDLDAEAIRVVKSLPKFIPGKTNGEPVRVWYSMPLMFKLAPSEKPASDSEITNVDPSKIIEARYPGGDEAMWAFVVKNIRYPEADALAGKSGEVKVLVAIGKDGSIGEIKIADNTGTEAMAAEAIRIIKLMPQFTPATQNGEPVPQWKTIPFTFRLR